MSRFFRTAVVVAILATPAALPAKPPPNPSDKVLIDGLHAMRDAIAKGGNIEQDASSSPQLTSQANQTVDHDQGDDHASDVAILKVCNHDNPSADRAAICPKPNSPP